MMFLLLSVPITFMRMPYSPAALETFRGFATKFATGSLLKTATLLPQLWKRIKELRRR
ncbi:MAG: hypothetical protein KF762_07910 [Acidobacteria bacterium]|nr:hypothetical protein [Acidobacteriota bacterium]